MNPQTVGRWGFGIAGGCAGLAGAVLLVWFLAVGLPHLDGALVDSFPTCVPDPYATPSGGR